MKSLILAALLALSFQAHSSLILQEWDSGTVIDSNIGGYEMTNYQFPANSILDSNGNPLSLTQLNSGDVWYWNTAENQDYETYLTDNSFIELILPEYTTAVSFNIGASPRTTRNNAWLTAEETYGLGISEMYWFNVNRNNSPGFSIHSTSNTEGDCSYISSLQIDPPHWGYGNMSISQQQCTLGTVPLPASIWLFGAGLIGFIGVSRRINV